MLAVKTVYITQPVVFLGLGMKKMHKSSYSDKLNKLLDGTSLLLDNKIMQKNMQNVPDSSFCLVIKGMIFASLLLFPVFVMQSHGLGASFERVVGEYKIDIGYDVVTFRAGEVVVFDFDISNAESGESVPFDSIWVKIREENKVFFASGIGKTLLGTTTMLYRFPQGGLYELDVRFQQEGETITQSSFPLTVEQTADNSGVDNKLIVGVAVLISLLIGLGIGFLLKR